jgi:hypothetical protein
MHHRRVGWQIKPPFLLPYRASAHEITGMTTSSTVFGRKLHVTYDLQFGAPPNKEQPMTNYILDLTELLHETHYYAC